MRSLLQNSFIEKASGLMLGVTLSLFSVDAFAATFTLKTGTNLQWNGGSATWNIDESNGLALNSSFPSYNDDVVINGGNSVVLNIPTADCASLTITSGTGNNTTSLLNVNGNTLNVNGNVAINGGNGNRRAELRLSGGTINIVGTINPTQTTGNSVITLNNGTAGSPNGTINTGIAPLPVELISFNAVKKAGEVALTWETASEKNNSGFELQASVDGKNYEAVAFVASRNGNSSAAQRYAYSHKTNNQEGLVYYRLKQIDLNGTFEYYTAKVVDLGRINTTVNTFPNPFRNRFELNLTATAAQTADILVMDMTGKTVYEAKQNLSKGANTISVELNNQPAGLYLIKATAGNQTYSNRLVKQ